MRLVGLPTKKRFKCINYRSIAGVNMINKLFIIGLPRTGTTSVSVALLQHHFKVAHTAYTKHAFELADVVSDAPCFCDYRELDQLFPGSQFVYLQRSLEVWVPSMQMLLQKMLAELDHKTGYLHPVLKRVIHKTFALATAEDPLSVEHLRRCYLHHQQEVMSYFLGREDLLSIDISQAGSLHSLLTFLGVNSDAVSEFPHLNVGKLVDNWKTYKHPNKVNSYSAGPEHRKFFDYAS
jgi:hypothetical protein